LSRTRNPNWKISNISTFAVNQDENNTFLVQVICGWIVVVVGEVVVGKVVVGEVVADGDAYVVVDEVEVVLLSFKKYSTPICNYFNYFHQRRAHLKYTIRRTWKDLGTQHCICFNGMWRVPLRNVTLLIFLLSMQQKIFYAFWHAKIFTLGQSIITGCCWFNYNKFK